MGRHMCRKSDGWGRSQCPLSVSALGLGAMGLAGPHVFGPVYPLALTLRRKGMSRLKKALLG